MLKRKKKKKKKGAFCPQNLLAYLLLYRSKGLRLMAKEKSFKKEKFQEGLVKEISLILRSEIKDSRLTFVSITKVELNKDNSLAKVYWDTFDSTKRGDVKKALGSVGSKIRGLLSSRLKVRHTPSLEFIYDSQFESEKKIDDLLKSEGKKAN